MRKVWWCTGLGSSCGQGSAGLHWLFARKINGGGEKRLLVWGYNSESIPTGDQGCLSWSQSAKEAVSAGREGTSQFNSRDPRRTGPGRVGEYPEGRRQEQQSSRLRCGGWTGETHRVRDSAQPVECSWEMPAMKAKCMNFQGFTKTLHRTYHG